MNRRAFLSGTAMGIVAAGAAASAFPALASQPAGDAVQLSFDALAEQMRERATAPYQAPQFELPAPIADLDYDRHRGITFNRDKAIWAGQGPFRMEAFHPGWLFREPVRIYVVTNGTAQEQRFSSDDFLYRGPNDPAQFENMELPGVAGFRLLYPLNRPRIMDELVSFLGASYFRALGRGNVYGLSARGIALNTATQSGEEFPRFDAFYLHTPGPDAETVTVWATMDSPSLAGVYEFVIRPGTVTTMEVTARLFLRTDVQRLGVAPLTSMFLFAENNRSAFRDYRNAVHDSDGLKVVRHDGEEIWRSLNNPSRLAQSFFTEDSPRAFGLFQRDRSFENYQDAEAWYERRPSLLVEPLDGWGKGSIALVEIPTELEVNDNIVAFWIPEAPATAGQELQFRYRLTWGAIDESGSNIARVVALRGGLGGVSGSSQSDPNHQKFVVDFAGSALSGISPDATELESIVRVQNAELSHTSLSHVEANDVWRLVIDLVPSGSNPVELSAFLTMGDTRVSELWLYQWRPQDDRAG